MHNQLDKLVPGLRGKVAFGLDLLLLTAALMLCVDNGGTPLATLFALLTAMTAGWGITISILRLYSPFTPRRTVDNLALSLLAVGVVTGGLIILDQLFLGAPPAHFASGTFLAFGGIGVAFTQLALFRGRLAAPEDEDPVLIVGTSNLGVATFQRLTDGDRPKKVLGFLRFEGEPERAGRTGAKVLGDAGDLLRVVQQNPVAEVYLAGEVLNQGREMQKLVKTCEELGLPFAVPLHSLRFNRAQLLSSAKSRDGYLHYLNTKSRPIQFALKRLCDIVLATIGLIVLSPLLLTVAAIIRLQDGGPALFRQRRVGLHGVEFNFLKFRSMVVNADALKDKLLHLNEQTGPAFKMEHDPRVTPIGRFIRKYSIDELPQLINVLRGDMTLVGPRPPVPREVAQYQPWQRRRLSVRPGLTCYWQVGGRNEIGFDEWMLLDLRYVDNWTLGKDLALIARTVPVVLLGKGAS